MGTSSCDRKLQYNFLKWLQCSRDASYILYMSYIYHMDMVDVQSYAVNSVPTLLNLYICRPQVSENYTFWYMNFNYPLSRPYRTTTKMFWNVTKPRTLRYNFLPNRRPSTNSGITLIFLWRKNEEYLYMVHFTADISPLHSWHGDLNWSQSNVSLLTDKPEANSWKCFVWTPCQFPFQCLYSLLHPF